MATRKKRITRKPARSAKASPAACAAPQREQTPPPATYPTRDLVRAWMATTRLREGDVGDAVALLRDETPLTRELRDAIADRLEGRSARREGRPERSEARKDELALECVFFRARLREIKCREGLDHYTAMEKLAQSMKITESKLKRLLYPSAEIVAIAKSIAVMASDSKSLF